jgi:hypothetical protein
LRRCHAQLARQVRRFRRNPSRVIEGGLRCAGPPDGLLRRADHRVCPGIAIKNVATQAARALLSRAMFVTFFHELKAAGVPVTLREYLTLVEAMDKDLAGRRVDDFYYLSRAALIKDERNLDKFDRVFGHVFKGLTTISEALEGAIPSEWLKKLAEK